MDGLFIINKPTHMTSFDVVRKIRKICNVTKVGHAGTLDPQATGVLLVGVGKATKCMKYFEGMYKVYKARMTLGVTSDTQDSTGKELSKKECGAISQEEVRLVMENFLGETSQVPPMVSALKHKGKPLYKYAREGVEIERKSRTIQIHDMYDVSYALPEVYFTVKCSKGTYIRTLCHDIGSRLGCGAVLSGLERLAVGPFTIDDALSLDEIDQSGNNSIPIEKLMAYVDK